MCRWLVCACLALLAAPATAREVRVPMPLDYRFVRELVVQTAFTDPERTALVYTDGVDCKRVTLRNPEVTGGAGVVTVRSDVETRLGTLFVGICLFRVDWSGKLESRLEPVLDPTQPLVRFRVLDSKLLESDGSQHATTAAVSSWLEGGIARRLERLAIDLGAPMQDLRAVLPLFLTGESAARAQSLVDSVALESVAVSERAVTLGVFLDAPTAAPPPARAPESELSAEELARFEAALSRWDGFITYVVKHAGTQTSDSTLRERLLEVLLEARQELVEALARPTPPDADPVRPLFLASWRRLGDVLRELGPEAGDHGVLRYLGFIAAADALAALDALGPELGLEMTSDGLRRLARVLAPADPADPLDAAESVDPELRRALDFGAPLAAPELDEAAPPEPAPEDESPPEPAPAPQSRLDRALRALLAYLAPSAQAAGVRPTSLPRLTRAEERRMRGWAPLRRELNEYLPLVQRLLRGAAEDALAPKSPAPDVRRMYLDLQLATAWQETCWRHYVRVKGQVIAIRSRAGAVGLMQVNSRVWRGFYDPRFLLADPTYNARAGSEILLRYTLDLALAKGEQRRPGGFDNLARAAYAAYNGGPSHLTRYRSERVPRELRAIDAAFFRKYQAVRAGRELEVMRCFG
jgi:hypothetical protein